MMKITASFVLGLLFVMHGLCDFTARANHQGKEGMLTTEKKELVAQLLKTSSSSRLIGIGGRKMAAGNGELAPSTTSATATKNSGATCEFEARKGDLSSVKCKLGRKSSSANEKLDSDHDNDHFVAFGADYHGPTRHPPRHN